MRRNRARKPVGFLVSDNQICLRKFLIDFGGLSKRQSHISSFFEAYDLYSHMRRNRARKPVGFLVSDNLVCLYLCPKLSKLSLYFCFLMSENLIIFACLWYIAINICKVFILYFISNFSNW